MTTTPTTASLHRTEKLCRNAAALDVPTLAAQRANIASNRVVLVLDAQNLHERDVETMAAALDSALQYLGHYHLQTQQVQVQTHGAGLLLLQLLQHYGVTALPAAIACESFAYSHRREEIGMPRAVPRPDGQPGPDLGHSPPAPL